MNRNHTIDTADGWSEHLRVPCVCLSACPLLRLTSSPFPPSRRGDVINLDVSQRCDERFGRGGCSLDPVKLSASALLFERFFFK